MIFVIPFISVLEACMSNYICPFHLEELVIRANNGTKISLLVVLVLSPLTLLRDGYRIDLLNAALVVC